MVVGETFSIDPRQDLEGLTSVAVMEMERGRPWKDPYLSHPKVLFAWIYKK